MSLSAREQQALDSIEDRLSGSEPKLASLLATFTRLAAGEEMPVRERIRAASWRHRRRRCRRQGRAGWSVFNIRLGWQLVMLVLGLAVAITLAAASLAAGRGGGRGTCKASWVAVCSGRAPGYGSRMTAHTMPLGLTMPTIGGYRLAHPTTVLSSAKFGTA